MQQSESVQDEELPQPPPRSVLRSRLLLAGAVLVGLALIVAVLARVATHSTPRAVPTVTVAPPSGPSVPAGPTTRTTGTGLTAASKPPAVLHVLRHLSSSAIAAAHAECPRLAVTCTTTGETPVAVVAALASAFPKAQHLVAVSDIAYRTSGGPRLVFRRLSAHAGRLTIAVEVRQLQPGDGTGSQHANDTSGHVVRYQTVVDGLSVEVQGSAPTDRYIDIERMARLGSDTRLLASG